MSGWSKIQTVTLVNTTISPTITPSVAPVITDEELDQIIARFGFDLVHCSILILLAVIVVLLTILIRKKSFRKELN